MYYFNRVTLIEGYSKKASRFKAQLTTCHEAVKLGLS